MNRYVLSSILLSGAIAACDEGAPESEYTGPAIEIAVAPLTLSTLTNACYDILIENGAAPGQDGTGNDVVSLVSTAPKGKICSNEYGNQAGGDITYIAPCDAQSDSANGVGDPAGVQNKVTIWPWPKDANGDLADWRNPCDPNNDGTVEGCSLHFDCKENQDTLVEFNFTIMREANQGFFDVAVNFDDIFCSAKLDTCYPDGTVGAADGSPDPITLLHGSDSLRDHTAVIGFACTAGPDSTDPEVNVQTMLLYGNVKVTCGGDVFRLDPSKALDGKGIATANSKNLNYAVYRGAEQLNCGGTNSCNKIYWNLALSLDDLKALNTTCTIDFEATANDNNSGFANGAPTAQGLSYPYIRFNTTLTTAGATAGVAACQQNPLNGVDPLNSNSASKVTTVYRGSLGGLTAPANMCHQFNGSTFGATGATTGCN